MGPTLTPSSVQSLVTHGKAWIDQRADVRLHYVTAGEGDKVAVLLHGAPETWYAWRRLIEPLTAAGYRLVMPDYRGAGGSTKPLGGYDKWTMAQDIHALVHEHLGISGPITLVGHDIGMMVAHAYTLRYRDDVLSYIGMEATLPGTTRYEEHKGSRKLWHFSFHALRDVPEVLTQGKERFSITRFFDDESLNPDAILPEDRDYYARSFEAPGAMRALFELYRAFEDDARIHRAALARDGKLTMPVLATGGAANDHAAMLGDMLREYADDVTHLIVPDAGHWVPEENPEFLARAIIDFDRRARS